MYRDTYDFLEKMENTTIANLRLLTRAPGQGFSEILGLYYTDIIL